MIQQILDIEEKQSIARYILEQLPEWFGIEEARNEYIIESKDQVFFAAFIDEEPIGFLCLKETGKDTVEIAVMALLKAYHHQGIGTKLFHHAKAFAQQAHYSFMQVKTVKEGCYSIYDDTNHFYKSLGFKEFEVFPTLWDIHNPCQIYVLAMNA